VLKNFTRPLGMPINPIHPLCNDCRFCADMVVETQIDGHLDLVTATLAGPYMTDFVVAHVCRRLWRDQQVIAFAARHSRARASVRPRGQHDHLPNALSSYGVGT
jgi:hypothetical protein